VTINLQNVSSNLNGTNGIYNANFAITYDSSVLQVGTITKGSLFTESADFPAPNKSTAGKITFLTQDDSMGERLITTNGEFAKINFTIKTGASSGDTLINFSDTPTPKFNGLTISNYLQTQLPITTTFGKVSVTGSANMTVTSIAAISDINVANGTTLANAGLPSTVQATLSDNSTQNVGVTWNGGTPAYNATTAGTYTFTGTLTMPSGVTNTNGVTATAHVIVATATVQGPSFQNASLDTTNNKIVTLVFDKALTSNVTDLKSAIKLATNGTTFNALGSADFVSISSTDATKLVVTFNSPLTGANNKIQIAANSLKDVSGNVQTAVVTTPAISGSIDECFIATAAFGSKNQTDVVLLRHFRDQFLLTNPLGKAFVETYYHYSPPIAQTIAGDVVLKFVTRVLLLPFVVLVYMLFHPVLLVSILAGLTFMILQRRRNKVLGFK
jgi:hypothetical protein